jgi:hypothetical protein
MNSVLAVAKETKIMGKENIRNCRVGYSPPIQQWWGKPLPTVKKGTNEQRKRPVSVGQ